MKVVPSKFNSSQVAAESAFGVQQNISPADVHDCNALRISGVPRAKSELPIKRTIILTCI